MTHSVVGIVHNAVQAENMVVSLQSASFANSEISVLFPDKEGTKDFAHANSTKAPEGAIAGASTGGVIGGALGLLAGIGALAIPGVGPLIAAGPIMAALSGAAVGATVLGVTGALVGMGMPEYEAKVYEGKIRDGNILVAIHSADKDRLKLAERIFKENNATDIHCVGGAAVKKS
ncbi:MAG: hypothetical protein K2W82_09990 [Candidatus Obscuribacterales bacterium]|nr:hypothetical protein [Candidatus Obscuribacterales bacterium]